MSSIHTSVAKYLSDCFIHSVLCHDATVYNYFSLFPEYFYSNQTLFRCIKHLLYKKKKRRLMSKLNSFHASSMLVIGKYHKYPGVSYLINNMIDIICQNFEIRSNFVKTKCNRLSQQFRHFTEDNRSKDMKWIFSYYHYCETFNSKKSWYVKRNNILKCWISLYQIKIASINLKYPIGASTQFSNQLLKMFIQFWLKSTFINQRTPITFFLASNYQWRWETSHLIFVIFLLRCHKKIHWSWEMLKMLTELSRIIHAHYRWKKTTKKWSLQKYFLLVNVAKTVDNLWFFFEVKFFCNDLEVIRFSRNKKKWRLIRWEKVIWFK